MRWNTLVCSGGLILSALAVAWLWWLARRAPFDDELWADHNHEWVDVEYYGETTAQQCGVDGCIARRLV